jgi:hypothetical protein
MPHWNSQDPSAFGWQHGPAAAIDRFTYNGHAFPGGVARGTDLIWRTAIDRVSGEPGFKLAESTALDAGMWGFVDRPKRGSSGWSFHAYGLAVDINAPWNPQSWQTPRASSYRLPVNTAELVRPLGILWGGGTGGFGDWMHLELHLDPGEVKSMVADLAGHPDDPPPASRAFPLPSGCYYGPYSGPASSISGRGLRDGPYRAGLAAAQTVLHVTPDGYYGPLTAAATVRFQAAHGLIPDGLIGPRTWAALFG